VHCEFSTADSTQKLTSTNREKRRITGLVGASSQKVGCQSPQFFVKRRVHCCLFTFKHLNFAGCSTGSRTPNKFTFYKGQTVPPRNKIISKIPCGMIREKAPSPTIVTDP